MLRKPAKSAAITGLVLEIFRLNGLLVASGDALVAGVGLTSARWQVLGAAALLQGRAPVAHIANFMGLTRQSVQRTADELEKWVLQERERVTAHLGATLTPDPEVLEPLRDLASRYALTAVSSSAIKRLRACFTATGLDSLIPEAVTFSAEDSLPVPTSKPDPAVYLHAGQVVGVEAHQGLAIEDSVAGVTSAVAAGYATVGNLMFLLPDERDCRRAELIDAGAVAITDSWRALADVLLSSAVPAGGSPLR